MNKLGRSGSLMTLTLAVSVLAVACGSTSGSTTGEPFKGAGLTGAGATFPAPIYAKWFKDFQQVESGAKINYQAIGSGGGVGQITAQTVDFGASDAPLKDQEISALPSARGGILEIPTVLGGVVVAFNVTGVQKSGFRLDGPTTADIFLGKVKTWNDQEIATLNPGVSLPSTPISVVHRSDESGTTKVFTSWLSAESPEWQSKVGADKSVQWPTGTGADQNDGVAANIAQSDGSIGYLSFDFAVNAGLGIADIERDSDGQFVPPSVSAIGAAGGILKFPISSDTNILNSAATGAYPISSTTYLLIYKKLDPLSQDQAQTLVDFLYWALTKGQAEVKALNYSQLPPGIDQQALSLLPQLTYKGKVLDPSSTVKA